MIEGKWFAPGADLTQPLAIRRQVLDYGADALDPMAWNVVVYREGEPAATGRIWWQDGAFWLGSIAVLPAWRGQQLGDLTLRLLLFKAQSHGARRIRVLSPAALTPFFTRLGFRPEGEAANGMQPLLLLGEELCLDSCQGCRKDCPNRR